MAKCPGCGEFIDHRKDCSCGWGLPKVIEKEKEQEKFLGPMNAELARRTIEAIDQGQEALEKLTEEVKNGKP